MPDLRYGKFNTLRNLLAKRRDKKPIRIANARGL